MTILTIDYSDLWNGFRTNDPLNWNTDMSDYWPFGPVHDFRTNEPSDQWPFRISNCPRNDHGDHVLLKPNMNILFFLFLPEVTFGLGQYPSALPRKPALAVVPSISVAKFRQRIPGDLTARRSRAFRKSVNLMRIDQISSISAWTWET